MAIKRIILILIFIVILAIPTFAAHETNPDYYYYLDDDTKIPIFNNVLNNKDNTSIQKRLFYGITPAANVNVMYYATNEVGEDNCHKLIFLIFPNTPTHQNIIDRQDNTFTFTTPLAANTCYKREYFNGKMSSAVPFNNQTLTLQMYGTVTSESNNYLISDNTGIFGYTLRYDVQSSRLYFENLKKGLQDGFIVFLFLFSTGIILNLLWKYA